MPQKDNCKYGFSKILPSIVVSVWRTFAWVQNIPLYKVTGYTRQSQIFTEKNLSYTCFIGVMGWKETNIQYQSLTAVQGLFTRLYGALMVYKPQPYSVSIKYHSKLVNSIPVCLYLSLTYQTMLLLQSYICPYTPGSNLVLYRWHWCALFFSNNFLKHSSLFTIWIYF